MTLAEAEAHLPRGMIVTLPLILLSVQTRNDTTTVHVNDCKHTGRCGRHNWGDVRAPGRALLGLGGELGVKVELAPTNGDLAIGPKLFVLCQWPRQAP